MSRASAVQPDGQAVRSRLTSACRTSARAYALVVGLLLATSLLLQPRAQALDVPPLMGAVNDYAGLLKPDEQRALESKLSSNKQATGHELTLLTVASLEGDTLEDLGIRAAEKWKLGSKKEDNGLILLVAPNERKMRIEVGNGLEGEITDAFSAAVIREVLQPAFRERDYAGGLNRAFDLLMAKAQGIAVDPPKASSASQRHGAAPLLVFAVVIFILISSWFSGSGRGGGRRRRGGFFFGPGIGGGGGWGGGGGGGGWGGGGGGGGGSWGGGGGSFGGGGASGDW
jgi:uncharacterized protein